MSTNGEAADAQPVEQKGSQAGPDDQPLHPNSGNLRSREQIMALVAQSQAEVDALSPEELRARGGDPVRGVSVDRAMDILDELEKDDEYDEDEESGAAEEGKPKVTDDKQDSKDKTSPEAGGAQDDKEKAAKEEHGS